MLSVIIPTYNAAPYLDRQLEALLRQSVQEREILIVDSSSTDRTMEIARSYPVRTIHIPKKAFDHGATRTLASSRALGDILVFLSQDAVPVNEYAVETLVHPLAQDNAIGVVFGRQVPHHHGTPFARHLRHFNYPSQSYTRTLSDRLTYGFRTAFCSNAFAAYRKDTLAAVGWFQERLPIGEDMQACAKLLLKGYKVGYVAEAQVYHSHNYSLTQEFKRYFDLGMFNRKEQRLLQEFGQPLGEGLKYAKSELAFLAAQRRYDALPASLMRSGAKFVAFKLGYAYDKLPTCVVKRLSRFGR